MKEINLNSSLFDITEQFPELIPVLVKQGFQGVANEQMRTSHARVMTIPKGCEMLGIDLNKVVKVLEVQGYTVKSA
ncbi:MAG: hypothetical protein A2Z15_02245 [Chloroflexi bacterium RBG_16_50_11]|nr:MAG: hypothetical protein A2Z15_02245 [Chloroflexi bacterium RBG_16_50_11]